MPKGYPNSKKPKKFATLLIAEIPLKGKPNPNEPDYRAAMALADRNTEQAVIIFDTMGDPKEASNKRSTLKRWFVQQKLDKKYDAVNRGDKVYLWATP